MLCELPSEKFKQQSSNRMSDADVIIIGSGFAGAICADRLSASGLRVVVLERGPWRDSVPVRSMAIQDRAPFPYGWTALTHLLRNLRIGPLAVTLNKAGLFELSAWSGLGVLSASAVGGGSHAWATLLTPPLHPGYWRQRHPNLEAREVEAHYDTVVADLSATRPTRDHWLANSIWTQLPAKSGQRCAPSDPQPFMGILLPRSEAEAGQGVEAPGGIQRAICALDGDSALGSRSGAKASVDFIHLAPAMRRGAVVRDLCEVTAITPDPGPGAAGYSVRFRDLRNGSRQVIRAPRVVLAAGTMNTLRLLHASSARASGITPMPSLGRTFGANGDLFGVWFKGQGAPSSFKAPPVLGKFTVDGREDLCFALAGLPGVDSLPMPGFVKRWLARTAFVLGMGADSGNGEVGYRNGRLRVRYDERSEPVFDRLRTAFTALEEDSGCKTWVNPLPLTLHPWGGARLGADADQGVIDDNGEVYGNPGLFVVDGAALPAAPGAAPTMAIAAWAHHVAGRLTRKITTNTSAPRKAIGDHD